jgi:hypothetical protein
LTIRADVEELQTTRTEKLLEVVLAAFLLLGTIWTYQKLDDVVRHHVRLPTAALEGSPAIQRLEQADARLQRAQARQAQSLQRLELSREAYRTALEAHRPAAALGGRYDEAQRAFAASRRELADASRAVRAAQPDASAAQRRATARLDAVLERQERDAFFARLGLVALAIVFAYLFLGRMRRAASRWFPLAGSVVATATILAFVLASDYLTDYVHPFDWGVALIALLGTATTLVAYWTLERYVIRRVPQRRVRRRQCPFCGYPAAENRRCEGCSREIVAPCATCDAPRRVGTPHCGSCGA